MTEANRQNGDNDAGFEPVITYDPFEDSAAVVTPPPYQWLLSPVVLVTSTMVSSPLQPETLTEAPPPPQPLEHIRTWNLFDNPDAVIASQPDQWALLPSLLTTMAPPRELGTVTKTSPLPLRIVEPDRSYVWKVDAANLRRKAREIVSPHFKINFGVQEATFKMMIFPKTYGKSFNDVDGKGYIQLKCLELLPAEISNVTFCLFIGKGDKQQGPRGPVNHNFSSHQVCGLPKHLEEWDFSQVVDTSTFDVVLEFSDPN